MVHLENFCLNNYHQYCLHVIWYMILYHVDMNNNIFYKKNICKVVGCSNILLFLVRTCIVFLNQSIQSMVAYILDIEHVIVLQWDANIHFDTIQYQCFHIIHIHIRMISKIKFSRKMAFNRKIWALILLPEWLKN